MARFKVVLTDNIFPSMEIERAALAAIDAELIDVSKEPHEQKLELTKDADGLLNLFYPIDRKFINNLERCKVLSRYGTGYDNVDVPAATEKGIAIANVPRYCTEEVSDQAMALIYSLGRKIVSYHQSVMAGKWDYTIGQPIFRMKGQVLGLIGFGNNARTLAAKAQGVGLRVVTHDPYIPDEVCRSFGVEPVSFQELLHRADYISIHAALNDRTKHLFSIDEFKAMKPTAVIINTARGGIIDNDALYKALHDNWIGGAGLEVTEPEPLPMDSPLRTLDNIIIVPHTAWYSEESVVDLQSKVVQGVVTVLEGKMPPSLVNKEVLKKLPLKE